MNIGSIFEVGKKKEERLKREKEAQKVTEVIVETEWQSEKNKQKKEAPNSSLVKREVLTKSESSKDNLENLSPEKLKKIINDCEKIMGFDRPGFLIDNELKRKALRKRRIALGILGDEGLDIIEKLLATESGKITGYADVEFLMAHGKKSLESYEEDSDDPRKLELEESLKKARMLQDKILEEIREDKEAA
jgi:hypothetical protein